MLLPKRVKYRRVQRGRMTGKATRGNVVCQGQYGLVALEPAWISSTQIEAARVAMTRYIKRGGKVWTMEPDNKRLHCLTSLSGHAGRSDCGAFPLSHGLPRCLSKRNSSH